MTEFDEIKAVQRIQQLLLERLIERTPEQIRRHAKRTAKRMGSRISTAYQCLEDILLSSNPEAENWEWE